MIPSEKKREYLAAALETEARLAAMFWSSMKEDMATGRSARGISITWRHLDASMQRMSAILKGDWRVGYPPQCASIIEGQIAKEEATNARATS